jgi:NADH-quinone oxidoreductase subunit L
MRIAMSILGVGALLVGLLQVPGITDVVETFLEGTFEGSKFADQAPSDSAAYAGLVVGGALAIAGIAAAAFVYLRAPDIAPALQRRFAGVHTFLVNKWYFDELIDAAIVRPMLALGRGANDVFERYVVQGLVGGTTGLARGANAAVRVAQSGYLRSYALLLVAGFAGLALYFLLQS